jgi:hypothetical protein
LQVSLQPQDDKRAAESAPSFLLQLSLSLAVVVFGCGNNISKQIAAKPLGTYTYMLSLATAVAYIPIYGGVMLVLLYAGQIPRHQLRFVWRRTTRAYPFICFFIAASLGDTIGDVLGMICTPYVSGPVHSLLSNCTVIFIALLSLCVLAKRYSLLQVSSLLGVFAAVILGILPSFYKKSSTAEETNVFFAIVLGGSCFFNAVAFLIKELLFTRYREWVDNQDIDDRGGLHVFVVNTHSVIFQLPFTLLLIPLNVLFGQTHGEGIWTYLHEALKCVFASSCAEESVRPDLAGPTVLVYVIFNILWNIAILLSVKYTGALATFVALKAVFPTSTILFAVIDWPLLGKTSLSPLVWASVGLILPAIGVYQWASTQQNQRAAKRPSQATCCWPLKCGGA